MSRRTEKPLYLKMPVEEKFIPLAAVFVNQAAKGLGLDGEAAEELSLAAEEVVAYLTRIGAAGQELSLHCTAGSHFIETCITLPVQNLQLRAFNLTAKVSVDDELGLDQMGLLIASRMTDRFRISRPAGGNLVLTLLKELQYPEFEEDGSLHPPKSLSQFSIETPDAARIKWFVRLVNHCYPAHFIPLDFHYPGKVVDMAAAGDCHILIAEGPAGEIGGGLVWQWEGTKTVEIFGPYIFNEGSTQNMASELLDTCIGEVARTSALALISRTPTPQLPDGYLEVLETRDKAGAKGKETPAAHFRLMHEDAGSVVWSHPDLIPFLQGEYQRLVFPRDIQPALSDGEEQEPFSVLSVETDRRLGLATLRPIWPGEDCEDNLAAHVDLLRQEEMKTIFFEMDLGHAWQTGFSTGLLKFGFIPLLILPYAGTADLLIFSLDGGL
jgi:anti-sigma regulatory factor (Ser/Thr protein kinase)